MIVIIRMVRMRTCTKNQRLIAIAVKQVAVAVEVGIAMTILKTLHQHQHNHVQVQVLTGLIVTPIITTRDVQALHMSQFLTDCIL